MILRNQKSNTKSGNQLKRKPSQIQKSRKKIAADFSNGRHWVGEISEGKQTGEKPELISIILIKL